MRLENAVAADVLERILSAYGFTMQKELSDKLGIAKSNVASWLQRGQVPGNVLVQCALDTKVDIRWLVTGKFANANIFKKSHFNDPVFKSGKSLIEKMLSTGGRSVLQRILDAYAFKTQKELSEYLGISTGTISTWVRREYFPGDVVIACALDTGVPLLWLATGADIEETPIDNDGISQFIPRKQLSGGVLHESGDCSFDLSFINYKIKSPVLVTGTTCSWMIEYDFSNISNGRWLLSIDGKYDIYEASLLPGGKITIKNKDFNFTCSVEEINIIGKVILIIDYIF